MQGISVVSASASVSWKHASIDAFSVDGVARWLNPCPRAMRPSLLALALTLALPTASFNPDQCPDRAGLKDFLRRLLRAYPDTDVAGRVSRMIPLVKPNEAAGKPSRFYSKNRFWR